MEDIEQRMPVSEFFGWAAHRNLDAQAKAQATKGR